jgi:hypothetical protein
MFVSINFRRLGRCDRINSSISRITSGSKKTPGGESDIARGELVASRSQNQLPAALSLALQAA